jgi:hypothetical protein
MKTDLREGGWEGVDPTQLAQEIREQDNEPYVSKYCFLMMVSAS